MLPYISDADGEQLRMVMTYGVMRIASWLIDWRHHQPITLINADLFCQQNP